MNIELNKAVQYSVSSVDSTVVLYCSGMRRGWGVFGWLFAVEIETGGSISLI